MKYELSDYLPKFGGPKFSAAPGSTNQNTNTERAFPWQRHVSILGLIFALAAFFVVIAWMDGDHGGEAGMGFGRKIFKYHPVFMSLACCCAVCSSISQSAFGLPKKVAKITHTFFHVAALSFIGIGIYCVVNSNKKDGNLDYAYRSNLYSLHSFIGLGVLLLYVVNMAYGCVTFWLGSSREEQKAQQLPYHIFLGLATLIMIFLAIETGIVNLTQERGKCVPGYSNTEDKNPAERYEGLPKYCKIANGAGVMFAFAFLFVLLGLYDFRSKAVVYSVFCESAPVHVQ